MESLVDSCGRRVETLTLISQDECNRYFADLYARLVEGVLSSKTRSSHPKGLVVADAQRYPRSLNATKGLKRLVLSQKNTHPSSFPRSRLGERMLGRQLRPAAIKSDSPRSANKTTSPRIQNSLQCKLDLASTKAELSDWKAKFLRCVAEREADAEMHESVLEAMEAKVKSLRAEREDLRERVRDLLSMPRTASSTCRTAARQIFVWIPLSTIDVSTIG